MYLNINRVEYVVTNQCSGRCKHCSVGNRVKDKGSLQYNKMKGTLTQISNRFDITSVMCFGGEPLLFANEVEAIMLEAKKCNIAKRHLITNGFFSNKPSVIAEVVSALERAEITEILLSVDAFHQESIPLEPVYEFARLVKEGNTINIRLHPAWVIDQKNDNDWNNTTKQIIDKFEHLQIPVSTGNNIFPSGNAEKYLSEYFPKQEVDLSYRCGQAMYSTKLDEVDTLSIVPNGDVYVCCFPIGNVYEEDINTIIDRYNPYEIPMMKILLNSGVQGLLEYAKEEGLVIDMSKHYSACGVCRDIVSRSLEGTR